MGEDPSLLVEIPYHFFFFFFFITFLYFYSLGETF